MQMLHILLLLPAAQVPVADMKLGAGPISLLSC